MDRELGDFGEVIGGAKKHAWIHRKGIRIEDLDDINEREYLKSVTKDTVWVVGDYMEYLEGGMEPVCIYFLKNVRDRLRAKLTIKNDGRNRERAERYIQVVNDVRDVCEGLKVKDDILEMARTLFRTKGYKEGNGWTKKTREAYGEVFDRKFIDYIQISRGDLGRLEIETEIQGFPQQFRGDLKDVTVIERRGKFAVVKGYRQVPGDSGGFDTIGEAIEFAKTDLVEYYERERAAKTRKSRTIRLVRPQLKRVVRTGLDIRRNKDITTELLQEAFKFRGGQFGNWNNLQDRQAFINYAYDALMDLAYCLGVHPSFISFYPYAGFANNRLAIAFGARGSGSALAHYEPGRVVINLTKMRGAGSLAHEWAHALDDFLGVQFGLEGLGKYASHLQERDRVKAYENVAHAFRNVMDKIKYRREKTDVRISEEGLAIVERRIAGLIEDIASRVGDNTEPGLKEKIGETSKLFLEEYDSSLYYELRRLCHRAMAEEISRNDDHAVMSAVHLRRNIRYKLRHNKNVGDYVYNNSTTDYYENSSKMDKGRKRGKKYYSEPHEMFARAFEAYVYDRLGFKSQYLVHSVENGDYGGYAVKPYPEGQERQVINKAIEELMHTIKREMLGNTGDIEKGGVEVLRRAYEINDDNRDKYSLEYDKETGRAGGGTPDKRISMQSGQIDAAVIQIIQGFNRAEDKVNKLKILDTIERFLSTGGEIKRLGANTEEISLGGRKRTCLYYGATIRLNKGAKKGSLRRQVETGLAKLNSSDYCRVYVMTGEGDLAGGGSMEEAILITERKGRANWLERVQGEIGDDRAEGASGIRVALRDIAYNRIGKLMRGVKPGDAYRHIAARCETNLNMGKVMETQIKTGMARGKSSGWASANGVLYIDSRLKDEKKLESILEPLALMNTMGKYGNTPEAKMLAEGVAYMLSRAFGLDVRNYCLTEEFERLASNKGQMDSYIRTAEGILGSMMSVLGINAGS